MAAEAVVGVGVRRPSDDGGVQKLHLRGLVPSPQLPGGGHEETSQAPPCEHIEEPRQKPAALQRESGNCPKRGRTSAHSPGLSAFPAPGIFIDLHQVGVPLVPVDFLHSGTTRGHAHQLLIAA